MRPPSASFVRRLDDLIDSVIVSKKVQPRAFAGVFGDEDGWTSLPGHPKREPAEHLLECVLCSLGGRGAADKTSWYLSTHADRPEFAFALVQILDVAMRRPKSRRQRALLHSAMATVQRAAAYRSSRVQELASRALEHYGAAIEGLREFPDDAFRIPHIRLQMGMLRYDAYGDEESVRLLGEAVPEDPWSATPGLYFGVASRLLRGGRSPLLHAALRSLRPRLALAYACVAAVDSDVPRFRAPRTVDHVLENRLREAGLAVSDDGFSSDEDRDLRLEELISDASRSMLPDRMAILTLLATDHADPRSSPYAREAAMLREPCRTWLQEHPVATGSNPIYSDASVAAVLDRPLDPDFWPQASAAPLAGRPLGWSEPPVDAALDEGEMGDLDRTDQIESLRERVERARTTGDALAEAILLCRRAHLRLETGHEGEGLRDLDRALALGGSLPDAPTLLRANAIRARYYRWRQMPREERRCRDVWLNVCALVGEPKYEAAYFPPGPKDRWSPPFEAETLTAAEIVARASIAPIEERSNLLYRLYRLATDLDRVDDVARAFATPAGERLLASFPDEGILPPTRGLLALLGARTEEPLAGEARARYARSLGTHILRTTDSDTRRRLIGELAALAVPLAQDPGHDEDLLLLASHLVKTGEPPEGRVSGAELRRDLAARNAASLDYLVGKSTSVLVVRTGAGTSVVPLGESGTTFGGEQIRRMFDRVAHPAPPNRTRRSNPTAGHQAGLGDLDSFLTKVQRSEAGEGHPEFALYADEALLRWRRFGDALLPPAAREAIAACDRIDLSTSGVLDNVPLHAVLLDDDVPLHVARSVTRVLSPADARADVAANVSASKSGGLYLLVNPTEGGDLAARFGGVENSWNADRTPEEHVAAMARARVALLLAHGIVANDRGESRVCLADGARLESRDLLHAASPPLDGQCVLLMACNGARTLGNRVKERFSSLGRSLVAAGAGSVLGCLWEADVRRTVDFAEELVSRLYADVPLEEALRAAVRTLSERESHPFARMLVAAPYVMLR